MERTSDQLLADLRRVKRRISRIESALMSATARERQIERRRAARLKFVVGGDVVGRSDRGEPDARAALEGAQDRARERDQALFDRYIPRKTSDAPAPTSKVVSPIARSEE